MGSSSLPELLTRVNFPLYNVGVLSPRHIIVGGGGGAAKTGVKNGFVCLKRSDLCSTGLIIDGSALPFQEIFELSHNGRNTEAESVCRHETGEFAVMNLSTGRYKEAEQSNVVAVGQDDKCQIFKVQMARQKISTRP